jgi:hypothetical protein
MTRSMVRFAALSGFVLCAVACDDDEPAAPPATETQPPAPAADPEPEPEAPEPPATPAPTGGPHIDVEGLMEFEGTTPSTTGFPAKSGDRIAMALVDSDGGRGNPNLTIRIANAATLATIEDHAILTADEYEQHHEHADALRAMITERVTPLETMLDNGHFAPLDAIGEADSLEMQAPIHLEGQGLAIGFVQEDGHLLIRRPNGPVLHESEIADGEGGTGAPGECGDVTHGPLLRNAWKLDDRHVLLQISYVGSDMCNEPPDSYRLIELSEADGRAAFASDATVECARFADGAYRAEVASSGIDLDGIECGEEE